MKDEKINELTDLLRSVLESSERCLDDWRQLIEDIPHVHIQERENWPGVYEEPEDLLSVFVPLSAASAEGLMETARHDGFVMFRDGGIATLYSMHSKSPTENFQIGECSWAKAYEQILKTIHEDVMVPETPEKE